MKPHFHKVPIPSRTSFSIRHDKDSGFGTVWHYHPELELHYLVRGKGVRFIGDNISNFSDGELILLGENLPHTWRVEEGASNTAAEVIIIHFLPNCLQTTVDIPQSLVDEFKAFKSSKKWNRSFMSTSRNMRGIYDAHSYTLFIPQNAIFSNFTSTF